MTSLHHTFSGPASFICKVVCKRISLSIHCEFRYQTAILTRDGPQHSGLSTDPQAYASGLFLLLSSPQIYTVDHHSFLGALQSLGHLQVSRLLVYFSPRSSSSTPRQAFSEGHVSDLKLLLHSPVSSCLPGRGAPNTPVHLSLHTTCGPGSLHPRSSFLRGHFDFKLTLLLNSSPQPPPTSALPHWTSCHRASK